VAAPAGGGQRAGTLNAAPLPQRRNVMIRPIAPTSLALLCALAISGPIVAQAYTGQELAAETNVTLAQARSIALQVAPGTITDQELEHEPGGSGLRYSFDVKRGGKTFEVGVDAKTGAVLENKIEGPNPD
jgi:Peptidase propeptide and YPEB domain